MINEYNGNEYGNEYNSNVLLLLFLVFCNNVIYINKKTRKYIIILIYIYFLNY